MVQSFDDLIKTIIPKFATKKKGNMREAVTGRQSLSITLGHLATEFAFVRLDSW
jgi:hypothetical protein